MCLICIELAKETLAPKDFWKNFRELALTDAEHTMVVLTKASETSDRFQEELAKEALLETEEEDFDDEYEFFSTLNRLYDFND